MTYSAQCLSPESIGNTTLLCVNVTPDHGPTTPLRFAGCFLREARLANATLAHQHYALRMRCFERLHSTSLRAAFF